MGRDTLNRAINSVLSQTLPPTEIIVVAGKQPVISKQNESKIKLILRDPADESVWNAAHNRNIGVKIASADFIAFLDDDDEWLETKMEKQLNYLLRNPRSVSVCSAYYRIEGGRNFVRPKKLGSDDKSILELLYGRPYLRRIPYYFPTPGMVISRELALETYMDENPGMKEDIWWLHELQNKGVKVRQFQEPLVIVHAAPYRSISRDQRERNLAWAEIIGSISSKYAFNFLVGSCVRNALVLKSPRDALYYFGLAVQLISR